MELSSTMCCFKLLIVPPATGVLIPEGSVPPTTDCPLRVGRLGARVTVRKVDICAFLCTKRQKACGHGFATGFCGGMEAVGRAPGIRDGDPLRAASRPVRDVCALVFIGRLEAASEGEPELGCYVGVIQVSPQQFLSLGDSVAH